MIYDRALNSNEVMAFSHSLDPITGPDSSYSAMYTLEDLYNRLDTGTSGTKRTGGFSEPTSAPGITGHTIDEIMSKMPVVDDINGVKPYSVCAGKTFWELRSDGSWGQQTGTNIYACPLQQW